MNHSQITEFVVEVRDAVFSFESQKRGEKILCGDKFERNYGLYLDWNKKVVNFIHQPFLFGSECNACCNDHYDNESQFILYDEITDESTDEITDEMFLPINYWVDYENGETHVVCLEDKNFIRTEARNTLYEQSKHILAESGLLLSVISETTNNEAVLIKNLGFLGSFSGMELHAGHIDMISEIFKRRETYLLGDLYSIANARGYNPKVVYALISQKLLCCDLTGETLNAKSEVQVGNLKTYLFEV